MQGRGIAYAQRNGAVIAIVAEVEVDRKTGRVWPRRFTAGVDHGLIVNPEGLRLATECNIIQATSRALYEEVMFDRENVTSVDWESYPIMTLPEALSDDDQGRIMVFICFNTDLGDGWEREGEDEWYFHEFSEKKAYPMGTSE